MPRIIEKPEAEAKIAEATNMSPEVMEALRQVGAIRTEVIDKPAPSEDPTIPIGGLPSKSVLYSNPISCMPLKPRDCVLLDAMDEDSSHSILSEIFGKRVRGIHPEDIMYDDETYITMFIREITFQDSPITYNHTCSKCKHRYRSVKAGVSDAVISEIPKWLKPANEFQMGATDLVIRPKIRGDEINFSKYVSRFVDRPLRPDDKTIISMACQIRNHPIEESVKIISDATASQFADLYHFMGDMRFGFTGTFKFVCGKGECGNIDLVRFRFPASYYIPKAKHTRHQAG